MQSLGFVETQGYVPAFAVADAMVKAANVEIVKKVWIGAAMVTIIVRGEVGAVRTAVDSGAAAANRMDALMGCYTIARPTPELVEMLQFVLGDLLKLSAIFPPLRRRMPWSRLPT